MGSYKDEITRLETDKYWKICLGGQLGRKETSEKEDKQTTEGEREAQRHLPHFHSSHCAALQPHLLLLEATTKTIILWYLHMCVCVCVFA